MTELASKTCVPCRGGVPPSAEELDESGDDVLVEAGVFNPVLAGFHTHAVLGTRVGDLTVTGTEGTVRR